MNISLEQYNQLKSDMKAKVAKYKNQKVKYEHYGLDGNKIGTFDSKKEMNRHTMLKKRELAGEISDIKRQVKFTLIPAQYSVVNGKRTCVEKSVSYYADFTYVENGKLVVEDVKSKVTKSLPAYILKRKMMLYFHSIQIKEV